MLPDGNPEPRDVGMAAVGTHDLVGGLDRLGLLAHPICLHSSLRSFGYVSGGPDAVIDAVLEGGATLIVPSFSWDAFAIGPTKGLRPRRNGWDYDAPADRGGDPTTYVPETSEIDRSMGAVPAAVVARQDHIRGDHPLCSFSALGPGAAEAVGAQTWDDVYAPLRWLRDNDGFVLLAGVGLTSMTLVHCAEELAGRTLFRRWVIDEDRDTRMVPVGGCSNGFDSHAPLLTPIARSTHVGPSSWTAYPAAATLETLVVAIRERPAITRCSNAECARCRDAVAGGPIL